MNKLERWKVMPCPMHAGKHPFHDRRWIATEDAEVEFGHDPRSWKLSSGSLICEMRDGPPENAPMVAASPALLAFAKWALHQFQGDSRHSHWEQFAEYRAGIEAIERAEGTR